MSYTIEVSPRLLYTLADGVSDEVYSPKAVHTISNYLGESSPNNVVVLTADNCIDPSSFTLFEEEFKSVVDLSFVEKEENFDVLYTLRGGICGGIKAIHEYSEGITGILMTKKDCLKYLK